MSDILEAAAYGLLGVVLGIAIVLVVGGGIASIRIATALNQPDHPCSISSERTPPENTGIAA